MEDNLTAALPVLTMTLWQVQSLIKQQLSFICFQLEHITSEQSNVPPVALASSLSFTAITVPGLVLLMLHTHVFSLPLCLTHMVTSSLTTWFDVYFWPCLLLCLSMLSTCLSLSPSRYQLTWPSPTHYI